MSSAEAVVVVISAGVVTLAVPPSSGVPPVQPATSRPRTHPTATADALRAAPRNPEPNLTATPYPRDWS